MKKSKWTISLLIFATISTFFIQSCVKDNFDMKKLSTSNLDWNPNIAIPIVNSDVTLSDILDDYKEALVEDNNHLISIIYEKEYSAKADSVLPLKNQHFYESLVASQSYPAGKDTILLNESELFEVSKEDEHFHKIVLKEGKITIKAKSSFNLTGTLTVTFDKVTENGNVIKIDVPIKPGGTTQSSSRTITDLCEINLRGANNNSYNQMPITYSAKLSPGAITAGQKVEIEIILEDLEFKSIEGTFAKKLIETIPEQQIDLSVLNKAFGDNVFFADPKLNITVSNSFTLPANIDFVKMEEDYYNKIDLDDSIKTFTIKSALVNGSFVETNRQINNGNTNSTFGAFLSSAPEYLNVKVEANLNPDNLTQVFKVLDTDEIKVKIQLDLPLHGKKEGFLIEQVAKFDLEDLVEKKDMIEFAKFRLALDNGFPIDGTVQAVFCDYAYWNGTDSVYHEIYNINDYQYLFPDEDGVIKSAEIDANGKVTNSTLTTTDVDFTKDKINAIINAKYIKFKINLYTTNPSPGVYPIVKFYSYYKLNVRFGMQAKFNFDTNSF
jgi:hypothetical protein